MSEQQVDALYREWLAAKDAYESYIRPDPEHLAATPEAEQMRNKIGRTWKTYYYTKYPDQRPSAD